MNLFGHLRTLAQTLTLFALSVSTFSATLYVPNIPGIFNADGTGIYDQVIAEASKRAGVSFDIQRQPYARALGSFAEDTSSCLPLGNAEIAQIYLGIDVVAPDAGYYDTKYILATKKGAGTISSTAELSGKRVVHLTGDNPADLGLDSVGAKFSTVQTHDQSQKMLSAGRVDVVMGADTDMITFIDQIEYDPSAVVFTSPESLICHPNSGNDGIVASIAEAIENMKADGTLNRLLGPLGQ
jgi:ABC-type amino acid transport substrate-binding protein